LISSGNINCGVAPNYNRTFNASTVAAAVFAITGGNLNVNGNLSISGSFIQGGGIIKIDGNDGASSAGSVPAGVHLFNINTVLNSYVTGGNIIIVDPPFGGSSLAFNCSYAGASYAFWANNTLQFGDGISNTPSGSNISLNGTNTNLGFGVSTRTLQTVGFITLSNVIINGNGINRHVSVAANKNNSLDIGNNLLINAGSELRTIGADTVSSGSVNVGGDLINNGRLVIGSNTTLGFRIGSPYFALRNQTVSGTGEFLNDTNAICSPCLSNITISNVSEKGVDLSGIQGNTININQPLGIISSKLTFANNQSYLNLGNKNLILGGSTTKPGILSGLSFTGQSNLILTSGIITRWFGAGTITSTQGVFPIGLTSVPPNLNRVINITSDSTLISGGTISVSYADIKGNTLLTPYIDAGITIDRRSNSKWTISTGNGITTNGNTLNLNAQYSGENLQIQGSVSDLRTTSINGISPGNSITNTGNSLDPVIKRTGLSSTSIVSSYYIGGSALNPLQFDSITNNIISGSQLICGMTLPAVLHGTYPLGGSGSYCFMWQSSTKDSISGFEDIMGGQLQNYNPEPMSKPTWFRRIVSSGKSGDTSNVIFININHAPVITNISGNERCGPGSLNINVTFNFGSVNWYSSASGGASIGSSSTFITPVLNNTTTYFIESISNLGCSSSRIPITAIINTVPSITSVTAGSRCDSGSVVLKATSNAGILKWYANSTGGTLIDTGAVFKTPVIDTNTTYFVEAANSICVSLRIAVNATINTSPKTSLLGKILVCENDTQTYTASGATNFSFIVSGGTIVSTTPNTVKVKWGSIDGKVFVNGANTNGCTLADSLLIRVKPIPNASLAGPVDVCSNTISIYETTPQPSVTYSWMVNGGVISGSNSDSIVFITWGISGTGMVKLYIDNGAGCIDSNVLSINIHIQPKPLIAGPDHVCEGTYKIYSINAIPGSSYNWTVTGGSIIAGSGTDSVLVNWQNLGSGMVSVIQKKDSCTGSNDLAITVNSNPPAPIVILNGNTLSTTAIANTYQWYNGTNIIPGATSSTYTPVSAGTYILIITNTAGCSSSSIGVYVNVGIHESKFQGELMITPNPGSGIFTIKATLNKPQEILIQVLDVNSKLIYYKTEYISELSFFDTINLMDYSNGIYLVQILTTEGSLTKKIFKE
jgi:hypothetical protein